MSSIKDVVIFRLLRIFPRKYHKSAGDTASVAHQNRTHHFYLGSVSPMRLSRCICTSIEITCCLLDRALLRKGEGCISE